MLLRNKNLELDKVEFRGFLHPESEPHMTDILVTETMADLDKVGYAVFYLKDDVDICLEIIN